MTSREELFEIKLWICIKSSDIVVNKSTGGIHNCSVRYTRLKPMHEVAYVMYFLDDTKIQISAIS